jgi:hypothetical protein
VRDEEYWTVERDYGGIGPQSFDRMRESAHGVIARTGLSSATEIGMARAILLLLDELADARGEDRRPPGVARG